MELDRRRGVIAPVRGACLFVATQSALEQQQTCECSHEDLDAL